MNQKHYVACDLGAESGRVILGTLADNQLQLEEVHRFPTGAMKLNGTLRWDLLNIFENLKNGLRAVAGRNLPIAGISVDSWGVDYVLLNKEQSMLSVPYHYRDSRNNAPFAQTTQTLGRETIFEETGIQFLPFNTLYQLVAENETNPELITKADRFLNIADYFHHLFCESECVEVSMASTTQAYNPKTRKWSDKLIEACHLPRDIFPPIVESGTNLGPLTESLQQETGLAAIPVIATCSHDTGAAVAAVPTNGDNWAYLSSGTWSLMGVELSEPLTGDQVREANFTNEIGLGNSVRFLKNIIGLWLLQECRREWLLDGEDYDYATLNQLADESESFRSLIRPDDARFVSPDSMIQSIADYCVASGQPKPETPGQFVRCIFESLALLYGQTLETLERLTGRTIERLHVVGGGSQSKMLNQFAADASGRQVIAGPVEATAIGNLLIQAIATGDIKNHDEMREIVKNSMPTQTYESQNAPQWRSAIERFNQLEAN